jgi:hypothetical protein
MWRVKKLLNSKVALRLSWGIMGFEVLYVIIFGPGRYGLIGRPLFWLGLLMSLMMVHYRDLKRRFSMQKRKNVWETIVVTLIALTLIPVWIYVVPKVREESNPNYDAALGPVLVEDCVYDYAQGTVCGMKDENPEMLPRGENVALGAIAVTGVTYFLLFTQVPKRMRKRTT